MLHILKKYFEFFAKLGEFQHFSRLKERSSKHLKTFARVDRHMVNYTWKTKVGVWTDHFSQMKNKYLLKSWLCSLTYIYCVSLEMRQTVWSPDCHFLSKTFSMPHKKYIFCILSLKIYLSRVSLKYVLCPLARRRSLHSGIVTVSHQGDWSYGS
jgi:hypothetical protein